MTDKTPDPCGSVSSAELGNIAPAVDWEQHRYSDGVLCEFRPRAEYQGRATKPGMLEKAGTRFVLRTMWQMDADDSYPGEYALSTFDSCGGLMEKLGIAWVASGDVVVLPNASLTGGSAATNGDNNEG